MNMQDWSQNVASIIDYAEHIFPDVEVVTRELSGKITKSNYKNISIRARKLASALEKHGIKKEQCVGSLGLNTFRNMEMFYGISGMGAIMHTINFRLHPEQVVYLINHAENKLVFL